MLTLLALAAHASTTLTGHPADGFGAEVSAAGDVDGDGYDDVLVAKPTGGPAGEGQVHLYRGSAAGLETTPAVTLTGPAAGSGFGHSVDAAGDVNGDGYGDVVVGGWTYDADRGYAAIYLGSALGLASVPSTVIEGLVSDDRLGASVAGVGDVDRDGYDDVAIGAPGNPMIPGFPGRVEVWAGNAAGAPTLARELPGEDDGSSFGGSVSAADVNTDGYADVLVGAEGQGGYTGAVYVFPGGRRGPLATKFQRIDGRFANDFFGAGVAGAGDIDADGYDDIVVMDRAGTEAHFTVLAGSATRVRVAQEVATDELVDAIDGVGDANLDGHADVVVGAIAWDGLAGHALLYPGGNSLLGVGEPTRAVVGESGGDFLGTSVAGAGDVDGDGLADIVAGASGGGVDGLASAHVIEGNYALDISVGSSPGTCTVYLGYADPGDTYLVYFSPSPGAGGPCPDALGGLCFDLRKPRYLGAAVANYSGGASITSAVPAGVLPGTPVTFQTVVVRDHGWQEIEVSRTITATITP